MTGALDGIVVADFSRVLAGPWCTMTLGDLGADVIKIERPGAGDETRGWGPPFAGGESAYYLSCNRNKRSIALDLSRADHRDVAERIVARSDIVVENFRPGTMERLGLGEARCRELNPGVIFAQITSFGPDSGAPGYDFVIQGQGGLMSVTGEAGGAPLKTGVAISDITTGLYIAIGILAALRHRDVTGEGQRVHVSLLGAQVSWLANQAANYLIGGVEPTRMGNAHPNIVPYRVFEASDGPFVLAVANEQIWRRFCETLSLGALAEAYPTNAARLEHRHTLEGELETMFAARTRAEWLEALRAGDVPCGPINSIAEVFDDPAVRALDLVKEVVHATAGRIPLVRAPFDLAETPATIRRAPPRLGEHTDELLAELGYGVADIERLTRESPPT